MICQYISVILHLALSILCTTQGEALVKRESPRLPTLEEILDYAQASMTKLDDYIATLHKRERFVDGEVKKEIIKFKFARPHKVYLNFLAPYKGREVIYVRGWNKGKLRVHKGSFPDITLNLDPFSRLAMKDNHHPITDFGLENTLFKAFQNVKRARERNEGKFTVSDGGMVNGWPTFRVTVMFPCTGSYTKVKHRENLWDIAQRTGQDMYLILYVNSEVASANNSVDDKLFIPYYHGRRAEFYFHKETFVPLWIKIWDCRGRMYEEYKYCNLQLNVGLSGQDFDPENKSYNF